MLKLNSKFTLVFTDTTQNKAKPSTSNGYCCSRKILKSSSTDTWSTHTHSLATDNVHPKPPGPLYSSYSRDISKQNLDMKVLPSLGLLQVTKPKICLHIGWNSPAPQPKQKPYRQKSKGSQLQRLEFIIKTQTFLLH